jgi:predicted DNA-binding protein (UPF0251 family)
MDEAIEDILKQYPFIAEDIKNAQAELNNYIGLMQQLKSFNSIRLDVENPLGAQSIDRMPHGTGISDQTGNLAIEIANDHIRLRDKYQREIDNYVKHINELFDRKKWLDKAITTLTEDERRILYLRYNERWQTWKIMQRLGIGHKNTFYKMLDSAKEKISKIMFT